MENISFKLKSIVVKTHTTFASISPSSSLDRSLSSQRKRERSRSSHSSSTDFRIEPNSRKSRSRKRKTTNKESFLNQRKRPTSDSPSSARYDATSNPVNDISPTVNEYKKQNTLNTTSRKLITLTKVFQAILQ